MQYSLVEPHNERPIGVSFPPVVDRALDSNEGLHIVWLG